MVKNELRLENSAILAAHPTDNQENPIVFLDINVGGALLKTMKCIDQK